MSGAVLVVETTGNCENWYAGTWNVPAVPYTRYCTAPTAMTRRRMMPRSAVGGCTSTKPGTGRGWTEPGWT